MSSVKRFDEIGVELAKYPELTSKANELRKLLGLGYEIKESTSVEAQVLRQFARNMGELLAPTGTIFVATVGRRGRISQPNGQGTYVPSQTQQYGIALGDKILPPTSTEVYVKNPIKWIIWNMGAVALSVVRIASGELKPTPDRIHLGLTAFNNLRVLPVTKIEENLDFIHELSAAASDGHEPETAITTGF